MKKIAFFLSFIMIIISMSMTVFANEPNGGRHEGYEYTQEELQELEKLQEEAWQNYSRFIRNEDDNNGDIGIMEYPDGYYKVLNVPVYQQPNNYWCGPAVAKQVTQFINGTSESMSTIALRLKTDTYKFTYLGDLMAYLNSKVSRKYAIQWDTRDYYTWLSQMYSSIDNNKPAVLLIAPTTSMGFPYSSNGHYVNTSGMDSKYSHTNMIRITDPWEPGLGNKWYKARDAYDALRNHKDKGMLI